MTEFAQWADHRAGALLSLADNAQGKVGFRFSQETDFCSWAETLNMRPGTP
jgi:hypothetical protein